MVGRIFVVGMALTGVSLFAQSATVSTGTNWENLTALGAVISALIYIVTKMLPDLHQKSVDQGKASSEALKEQGAMFATTIKDIQIDFSSTLDKVHERGTKAMDIQSEKIATLQAHCARIHGLDDRQNHAER
jgi:hypothetical protein